MVPLLTNVATCGNLTFILHIWPAGFEPR